MISDLYPKGSDLTLINTMYLYPKKDPESGKYDDGSLTLVYKDNITNEKKIDFIENPDYEFFIAKDEEYIDHNMLFTQKEKVNKVKAPFKDLEKNIAQMTDNERFYYENIQNGNRYANKKLHTFPRLFLSDTDIEDHYRFRFTNRYTNNVIPISKSYFDIEADTIHMKGDFPQPGECPINAITIICQEQNKVFTLLLRNKDNPLIEEFEKSINNNLFDELKGFIREKVGGWKNEIRFGLDKYSYEMLFYDEEIQLIQDLFNIINAYKPDFVLAWNMAFDIPYIIARIKELGYDPADIMCHPDFPKKIAKYYIDERNKNEFAERGDKATISSYSVFLDQLIHFASRRKGQGMFDSFGLDYIGTKIAKVSKLDYSHLTTNIAQLPYLDYKTFVFYNIFDTIVQQCIEVKTGDIDYIFSKCLINNTRYAKGHRQTVYLVNRAKKEFYNDGFIMGNNVNKYNEKPDHKFPGAFVANPRRLTDYARMTLYGVPINVFNNLIDFDYKSLYPSDMREMNVSHNTQIGRILIDEIIYANENRFKNIYPEDDTKWNRSTEFIENFHSHNYLEFCTRWLNLADYLSLYKDIEYYFTHVKLPYAEKSYDLYTGLRKAITIRENKDLLRPAIRVMQEGELINPITIYKKPHFTDINNYFETNKGVI